MKQNQSTNESVNQNITSLALYHYQSCPFCGITREAIRYLEQANNGVRNELKVEQRDILIEPAFRQELIRGGGKAQVPCLKIETENGTVQWLYESRDIIRFLQRNETPLKQTETVIA